MPNTTHIQFVTAADLFNWAKFNSSRLLKYPGSHNIFQVIRGQTLQWDSMKEKHFNKNDHWVFYSGGFISFKQSHGLIHRILYQQNQKRKSLLTHDYRSRWLNFTPELKDGLALCRVITEARPCMQTIRVYILEQNNRARRHTLV